MFAGCFHSQRKRGIVCRWVYIVALCRTRHSEWVHQAVLQSSLHRVHPDSSLQQTPITHLQMCPTLHTPPRTPCQRSCSTCDRRARLCAPTAEWAAWYTPSWRPSRSDCDRRRRSSQRVAQRRSVGGWHRRSLRDWATRSPTLTVLKRLLCSSMHIVLAFVVYSFSWIVYSL